MASINASTAGVGGVITTADNSGVLNLQTAGTTAITVDASQKVTIQGLTVGKGGGAVATNTAVGVSALTSNTTGINNTAVGFVAAYSNTSGSNSVALGRYALYGNTSGGSNTAIGHGALEANTTASYNTAVGYQAGYTNTTGQYNTFVGYQAGLLTNRTADNQSYNDFFGYGAGAANVTGQLNAYFGATTGGGATGSKNSFFGVGSGGAVTTGSSNTILGRYNGNQGGLNITTASNYIVLSDGDGNPRFWYNGGNNYLYVPAAYSQTSAAAANLVVGSDGSFQRSTSALKYKQDVRDLELIDINKFRPVRYKSKSPKDDQTKDHFGIIADEVDEAGITELVSYGADGEVEGFQYERLTVVLLKAIQELKAEIDLLKGAK